MKYLCVQCDKTFEGDGSERPRCPACLRTNSIEAVAEIKKTALPKHFGLAAGLAFVVVVAGGYAFWSSRAPSVVAGDAPLRPLSQGEILGYLAAKNAAFKDAANLFHGDDGVEEFAEQATANASTPDAKATAIVAAVRDRATKQAFVPWSYSNQRDADVLMPKAVRGLLSKDGGHARLYPLEIALFTVAALRAVSVDAMLAEIPSFEGEKAPPDPSGRYGYFGVAVYPGKVGEGTPKVYDPVGGHAPFEGTHVRVLSDVQGTAAFMSHHATHALLADGNGKEAYAISAAAVALDGRSPVLRGANAAILAYVGGGDEALKEFQTAVSLRDDGPRRMFQVQLAVTQGDGEGALKVTHELLQRAPEYAEAHAMLAQIHLSKQEVAEAEAELNLAQRFEPQLATLPMLWANYYVAAGNLDKAAEYAEKAAAAARHNWHTRLKAAWVLHAANRYDAMRREAKLVLADVEDAEKPKVREMILGMLGPTALEDAPTAAVGPSADPAAAPAPDLNPEVTGSSDPSAFQLSDPSAASQGVQPSLLGGARKKGPSLLGPK